MSTTAHVIAAWACAAAASLLFLAACDRALAWRRERAVLLERSRPQGPGPSGPPVHAVCYGDSFTARFPFGALLPPGSHAVNRGVSGESALRVMFRYVRDAHSIPPGSLVILQGGVNDLLGADHRGDCMGVAVATITGAFDAALDAASEHGHRALVLGAYPVTRRRLCASWPAIPLPTRFNPRRVNRGVAHANDALRDLCGRRGMPFLEVAPALCRAGRPDTSLYTTDGYHLNAEGYARVAALLPGAAASASDAA